MPRNWKTARSHRKNKRSVGPTFYVAHEPPWWARPNAKREAEEGELRRLREERSDATSCDES